MAVKVETIYRDEPVKIEPNCVPKRILENNLDTITDLVERLPETYEVVEEYGQAIHSLAWVATKGNIPSPKESRDGVHSSIDQRNIEQDIATSLLYNRISFLEYYIRENGPSNYLYVIKQGACEDTKETINWFIEEYK